MSHQQASSEHGPPHTSDLPTTRSPSAPDEQQPRPSLDAHRQQQVVTVADTDTGTRWPVVAAQAAEAHVGRMMSMPLTAQNDRCGVLTLHAAAPTAFAEGDERSAMEFADRAAIALHRAAERDHRLARTTTPELKPGRRPWRRTVAITKVTRGLRVTTDRVGGSVVVRAAGVVDLNTTGQLAAALHAGYTAEAQPDSLVIDLTGIRFLSVAGLAALVTAGQQCDERHLTLRVVASHHSVLRPMRVTGLDSLFDIAPSPADVKRPHLRLVKRRPTGRHKELS